MVRRSNRDGLAWPGGFVAAPSRFEGKLQMVTTPCIGRNVCQSTRCPVIRIKHVECLVPGHWDLSSWNNFDSEPRAGRNRRYHTGFCVKQFSLEDCQEGITVGERSIVEGADGEVLRVY
jgi:hypothetical protein